MSLNFTDTHIGTVPTEILILIGSFLNTRDYFSYTLTCKHLYSIRDFICIHPPSRATIRDVGTVLTAISSLPHPNLRRLTVSKHINDKFIQDLIVANNDIKPRHLTIHRARLTTFGCSLLGSCLSDTITIDVSDCPNFNDGDVSFMLEKVKHLVSLNISKCTGLTWSMFDLINDPLTSLTDLNISDSNTFNGHTLKAVASKFTNLRRLDISRCPHVVWELDKLKNLTDLQHLSVDRICTSNDDLEIISTNHTNLTSLDMGSCNNIGFRGISLMATNLTKLHNLNIGENTLDIDCVRIITDKLTGLTDLNIGVGYSPRDNIDSTNLICQRLTNLTKLRISTPLQNRCHVPPSCDSFKFLTSLTDLDISNIGWYRHDIILNMVGSLTNLTKLNIPNTMITVPEYKRHLNILLNILPDCDIISGS